MTNDSIHWRDALDARQRKAVAHAECYVRDFNHGATGHNDMVLIARLAELLDTVVPPPATTTDEPTASSELAIVQITQRGADGLAVRLAAATESSFEVVITADHDYDRTIADICAIAPIMMRLDAALMDAYDDGGRSRPSTTDRIRLRQFVEAYHDRIKNARVGFSEFDGMDQP